MIHWILKKKRRLVRGARETWTLPTWSLLTYSIIVVKILPIRRETLSNEFFALNHIKYRSANSNCKPYRQHISNLTVPRWIVWKIIGEDSIQSTNEQFGFNIFIVIYSVYLPFMLHTAYFLRWDRRKNIFVIFIYLIFLCKETPYPFITNLNQIGLRVIHL